MWQPVEIMVPPEQRVEAGVEEVVGAGRAVFSVMMDLGIAVVEVERVDVPALSVRVVAVVEVRLAFL